MDNNARDRIAERVKNAYAAGYNDGRKGLDRMDRVAETETAKILEGVREVLLDDRPGGPVGTLAVALMDLHGAPNIDVARNVAVQHLQSVAYAAFPDTTK